MSKWKKVALWKKILIGVVIGLIIGLVSPKAAEVISPLGDIFLRMLKMLIVPLVFFSITSGVCKMGDVKQLRTVGIRYVLWIMASAVIAAICGVIGGLIVQPGRGTTEFLAAAEAAEAQSYSFMRKIAPAILVAVSTSSSAATLPVSIKISEEDLGIPENIYGFTLPLGNTAGMTGFAVFIGLCCVFASNLYGFPVTFSSVLQFVFFGLILSIGAAGVKGAGVVMSGVLLEALGMPLTLIPILAAIWPVIDPAHTTLNNVGDLVGTTVVARSLDRMDMDVYNNAK